MRLGTTAQTLTSVEEPAIDNTTNRISSSGYTFDANGNLIVDADGRQFTFNGDNRQTKVLDDEDVTLGEYFFDGEGKRVKKVTASETTVFVYSGSKLIAEYSTATPPSNPTTSWTVTDQLGSPRVIVNALGAVVSRRDFMPFGEELGADGTYRTTSQKYGQADSVRQKFTGYQKDEETGLDFAEARMYQNLHGRFTAIDPLLASGKSANPQTFNRYVYVMNDPIRLVDRDGRCPTPTLERGQVGICIEAFIKAKRIDTYGHGDGRDHVGDDPDATARMRYAVVISTTETSFNQTDYGSYVNSSSASVPLGDGVEIPLPTLPARGRIEGVLSSTTAQGSEGFGDGRTSSTMLRVEMRDGANGYQTAAQDIQSAGDALANSGLPIIGTATNRAGQVMESKVPPGTIDVRAQIRITGSGDNIRVQGTAQSRPFPSVTGYAYTRNADGSIKTTELFRQDETKPSELTKPMRPIR